MHQHQTNKVNLFSCKSTETSPIVNLKLSLESNGRRLFLILIINRLYILILFAASCHSQGDSCQDIDKPPTPTSNCCGIQLASDDIEKSGDVTINQFPWVVLIENEYAQFYTGSLISSRHVLTTAQVTKHNYVRVRLGVFNRNQTGQDCVMVKSEQVCNDGAITIAIAAIKSHPEFKNNNPTEHDIAVIKLAEKVPYSEFIRPICLPTGDVLVSPPDNLRFINAGWGDRPSNRYEDEVVKHYVTLPYIDLKSCQKIFEHGRTRSTKFKVVEGHVCAGGEKDLGTCRGNGGGPLMFKENGHYTLVGIVSFDLVHCGREGVPSVFTKVYPYLLWINSVIASL